jgi:hypothetical protein
MNVAKEECLGRDHRLNDIGHQAIDTSASQSLDQLIHAYELVPLRHGRKPRFDQIFLSWFEDQATLLE